MSDKYFRKKYLFSKVTLDTLTYEIKSLQGQMDTQPYALVNLILNFFL